MQITCLLEILIQLNFFGKDKEIVAGIHPCFFNKSITEYTLETRYKSLAYVSQRYIYAQGCINGGVQNCIGNISTFIE